MLISLHYSNLCCGLFELHVPQLPSTELPLVHHGVSAPFNSGTTRAVTIYNITCNAAHTFQTIQSKQNESCNVFQFMLHKQSNTHTHTDRHTHTHTHIHTHTLTHIIIIIINKYL